MPSIVFPSLKIFIATRREDVPADCVRYLSVDGTVPGFALRWDHHTTGERINLEAMPDRVDATGFDGVGTTLADMDAVVSVVAVLVGGKAELPPAVRAVFESASHWCDHLTPHAAHDAETNRLGRGLLDATAARLSGPPAGVSERFAAACRALAEVVVRGEALPYSDAWPRQLQQAEAIARDGRLTLHDRVALIDLRDRGAIDPLALYTLHHCPVAVSYAGRDDGGLVYTVGVNPFADPRPTDLGAALRAVAAAEFAHGPPALGPEPIPGRENWGGRATVFGSPWNYGSRLRPEEVVALVSGTLD